MISVNFLLHYIDMHVDRIHFDEISCCLNARAYRSAYIMTWIALAESLKSRFFEMEFRDSEISKIATKLNEMESQKKPTDTFILDKAKDVGIVSADERIRLG